MAPSQAVATAVMPDTAPGPTALYIARAGADPGFVAQAHAMARDAGMAAWIWEVAEADLPPLPRRTAAPAATTDGEVLNPWRSPAAATN